MGLYYYGARYYEPRISLWINVDPLAEKYPALSGFCFVGNNRPDVQFDKHGVHTSVEYDTQTRSMNKHKEQLPKNDNQARNKFYKVNGK